MVERCQQIMVELRLLHNHFDYISITTEIFQLSANERGSLLMIVVHHLGSRRDFNCQMEMFNNCEASRKATLRRRRLVEL